MALYLAERAIGGPRRVKADRQSREHPDPELSMTKQMKHRTSVEGQIEVMMLSLRKESTHVSVGLEYMPTIAHRNSMT